MDVAFVVYNGLTALDLVGAYDPITRIGTMGLREDLRWDICGLSPEVTATGGLTFKTTVTGKPLEGYDVVIVPGGIGTTVPDADDPFVEWIRGATTCQYKTSVCTGSLLLAAAGLLDGKRATTHPSAYNALADHATVVERRVVHDGDVITGGGVSSALDFGLYLVELLTDTETRRYIATQMNYPYYNGYTDDT